MSPESKIFVAGHKGLVGSAITGSLKIKGYNNLILKTKEELDLTDQKLVDSFFANELPEYVILAAAIVGGIMANNTYRADFIYQNLIIQTNVIHSAWKYGVKKLIFLGSTCIYPKNAPQPLKEDYLLSSPLEHTNEPYAIAKIAGLKMCESYNKQYNTNFISVMPTNLYGPGDNFNLERAHVLPSLLRKFHLGSCLEKSDWVSIRKDLDNNPVNRITGNADTDTILDNLKTHGIRVSGPGGKVSVTVWGSGTPLREFMYSADMANACVHILENTELKDIIEYFNSGRNEPDYHAPHFLNIGTGEEISIRDLSHRMKSITGFKGEIVYDSSKPDGTMRKVTDISALRSLGFIHKTSLTAGLEKMYRKYIE